MSGSRPSGVTTTGAFQAMVYVGAMRPFARPVIVGSELVSFSAILAARHAGIKPVAMLEERDRITARWPSDLAAKCLFGVKVMTKTKLVAIRGGDRVEAVEVECRGVRSILDCDGVIFTGLFRPEATLVRNSHLIFDAATQGPAIDNFWRCSDPSYFAAGNVVRAVEHSGRAAAEGRSAALSILLSLRGDLPDPAASSSVGVEGALSYVYPQRVHAGTAPVTLYARAARPHRGQLRAVADGKCVYERVRQDAVEVTPGHQNAAAASAGERPRQPVDLVDDDHVDLVGQDIVQQLLKGRSLHRTSRKAAVVIALPDEPPSLMGVALDVGIRRLALVVEGVEVRSRPESVETRV